MEKITSLVSDMLSFRHRSCERSANTGIHVSLSEGRVYITPEIQTDIQTHRRRSKLGESRSSENICEVRGKRQDPDQEIPGFAS